MTLTSECLAGTHPPVRGDRDEKPRDPVDPAQLSKLTSYLSPISSQRNNGLKAQLERED